MKRKLSTGFKNVCKITSNVFRPEVFKKSIRLKNEPILEYEPYSKERTSLENALDCISRRVEEIPIVINGQYETSRMIKYQVVPHMKNVQIAKFYYATEDQIFKAIKAATQAQKKWDEMSLTKRINIWKKAAELMSEKYRADLVAMTILGQSKTVYEAEIDAGAKLTDFMRMNAEFLKANTKYQPKTVNGDMTNNFYRFRGLEGFVAAISSFYSTAVAANLAYAPALMGNAVVWRPSDNAMLSSWKVFCIMREAGLPDGVVNFVPASGPLFRHCIINASQLAGINFTGSLKTFRKFWRAVGNNINIYETFPRLVGQLDGKNFHFVHPSADPETVIATTIRSAFEYNGQKSSSCSRLYVPRTLWKSCIKTPLIEKTRRLLIGDARRYECMLTSVIDDNACRRIIKYFDYARQSTKCKVLCGGHTLTLKGSFILPTIILVQDPHDRLMYENICGPVLTVYVYKETELDVIMDIVANKSPCALTASIFGNDVAFINEALTKFKNCAGNFHINDKSTDAVVGQQPYGGGRLCGTGEKAGGPDYLLRWTSPQTIKESYYPKTDINYPYMHRT